VVVCVCVCVFVCVCLCVCVCVCVCICLHVEHHDAHIVFERLLSLNREYSMCIKQNNGNTLVKLLC
jgi:hypothetical protein